MPIKYQPRLKVPRVNAVSALEPQVRKALEREAKHWNCSIAFVMNNAIAYALNIEYTADYAAPKRKLRKVG